MTVAEALSASLFSEIKNEIRVGAIRELPLHEKDFGTH